VPRTVPAQMPSSMKPAWLIDEYASIRFTLRCTSARLAPTRVVSAIITQRIGRHVASWVPSEEISTRTSAAKAPTFTLEKAAIVTEMMTYHYIVGGGPTPGTIGLKAADGTVYGPWSTTGLDGQGAVKNAYWDAKPNAEVPAGTYTVMDSDPGTWSTNDQAKGLGFVTVLGTYK